MQSGTTDRRAGRTVLIVEDNELNMKLFNDLLEAHGYTTFQTKDGREALDKLEASEAPYDVVLMDVQMPALDGLETTRILRRDPRFARLPIIAMTAHAMTGDRQKCLEAGMNAYLSKPVQAQHLIATIEAMIAGSAEMPPSEMIVN